LIECITYAGNSMVYYVFALCDPVTLNFDLSTPRSFPIPSLNTLGSFVFEIECEQTDRQTDRHTDAQTDMDECFTHATIVGVSNE